MKLRVIHYVQNNFLLYFVLEVTANCICEIHRLALNGFNLNTVHQLSSREKNITGEPGFESGAAGWEARMLPLCYAAPLFTGVLMKVNKFVFGTSANDDLPIIQMIGLAFRHEVSTTLCSMFQGTTC